MTSTSSLQGLRMQEKPELPKVLNEIGNLTLETLSSALPLDPEIAKIFPFLSDKKLLKVTQSKEAAHLSHPVLKVGVLFSGGPASGGHNVVIGLFDGLKKLNLASELYGFVSGPEGLIKNDSIKLTKDLISPYLNQGGFDLLGTGRTKFESVEQFQAIAKTVTSLNLDGLVIIGGDDSNTNAAFLAEYFAKEKIKTNVIGVPKTIDGDLKNEQIEIPFGFDTACKTFSATIGSLAKDAISAKKYYYFVKMMGRTASHVTLECALETKINMAIISEEVEKEQKSLDTIISEIAAMIVKRSGLHKDYGVILIPEGILEFIPEVKLMILELNEILKSDAFKALEIEALENLDDMKVFIKSLLSANSLKCFLLFPDDIQMQLLQERDPHGNIQLSKIETESLILELVRKKLKDKKIKNEYHGKFNPQPIFLGYEGRSCLPSLFDSRYTYCLGHLASVLIDQRLSGYMVCIQNLKSPVIHWQLKAVPILSLMHMEKRQGKLKAVIAKSLVDLKDPLFLMFKKEREVNLLSDDYLNPGPIQFYGPSEITDKLTLTLLHQGKAL